MDKVIDGLLRGIFSVPSLLIHMAVFGGQLIFHLGQAAITNYISWEAIFLSIMIGIQQLRHTDEVKRHITNKLKEVR